MDICILQAWFARPGRLLNDGTAVYDSPWYLRPLALSLSYNLDNYVTIRSFRPLPDVFDYSSHIIKVRIDLPHPFLRCAYEPRISRDGGGLDPL